MAKKITQAEVEKIAALARLHLTPAEKRKAVSELGRILEYIDRLSEVNTEGVAPFVTDAEALPKLREDKKESFQRRNQMLASDNFRDGLLVTRSIFSDDGK